MPLPRDLVDDDDYVAALLKRDAERRIDPKYPLLSGATTSASGPNRRRNPNLSTPNTRFLKNIIRDTDQHNALLKAREESESQARLRNLDRSSRKITKHDRAKTENSGERKDRWSAALSGLGQDSRTLRKESAKANPRSERDVDRSSAHRDREGKLERSHRHDRRRDVDQKLPTRDVEKHSPRTRRRSERSASPRQSSRRRDRDRRDRTRSRSPINHHRSSEDSFGPRPLSPTQMRGRGHASSHGIDDHFDSKYDPRTDIGEDDVDGNLEDLGNSIEAHSDRAHWRKIGADRLLAAGFTTDQVKRWEKGGEKNLDDVRWTSKDEVREWDRGKKISSSGDIELKASWITAKKTRRHQLKNTDQELLDGR